MMKKYSDEEIENKVQEIYDASHKEDYCMGWESAGCIEIKSDYPNKVEIVISCMYESPSPTLSVLKQLFEFFETDNINDDDHFSYSGCETCDYGSEYGYTLTVRPKSVSVPHETSKTNEHG
jgi:hypothetical protein